MSRCWRVRMHWIVTRAAVVVNSRLAPEGFDIVLIGIAYPTTADNGDGIGLKNLTGFIHKHLPHSTHFSGWAVPAPADSRLT